VNNKLVEYTDEIERAITRLARRIAWLEAEIAKAKAERRDDPPLRDVVYLPSKPFRSQRFWLVETVITNWQGDAMTGFWVTWNGENWMSDDHQVVA